MPWDLFNEFLVYVSSYHDEHLWNTRSAVWVIKGKSFTKDRISLGWIDAYTLSWDNVRHVVHTGKLSFDEKNNQWILDLHDGRIFVFSQADDRLRNLFDAWQKHDKDVLDHFEKRSWHEAVLMNFFE